MAFRIQGCCFRPPLNVSAERHHPGKPFHVRWYSWHELERGVAKKFSIERRFTQASRLGRLRELIGGDTHGTASTSASAVGSERLVDQSSGATLGHRARSFPFLEVWDIRRTRGTILLRAGGGGAV